MADDKLRVLIVEDSLLTVRVLSDMINTQPDMTVAGVATTGQEAVRLAAELRPDVILMDIHLPDVDGVSAKWVIASRNPDSSVIMVTSEGRTEYLQRAMVAGAQGYLLKPILDPTEMANTIRTVRQHALERWALLTPPGSVAVEAMRAELAARAEGAELLHRVAADAAGRRDVREIAESAATALRTLYQADAVGFFLRNDDGSVRTVATIGLSPEYVERLHEVYAVADAPRTESGSAAVRDLASAPDSVRMRDALLVEGFVSQVLIPAITQGRVVGRLVLYHRQPRGYRPHEIELLEIFAEQMAGAIGLAQAYTAVETLDRQREEFLALVSHELRQPVAAIATTAELLGDTPGLGPAEQRALGILRRQARRLAQLAEDVLAVARLETGRLRLQRTAIDLGALVASLVRANPDAARISVHVPAEPLLVDVDPERIGQGVDNLLSNALKYSRAGDPVEVSVRGTDAEACVEVRDSGVGLDPDELAELFKKYGRNPRTAGIEGIGLGLYLTRLLVEAHGGRIQATSPGRAQGTTFTVHLPRSEAGQGAGAAHDSSRDRGKAC